MIELSIIGYGYRYGLDSEFANEFCIVKIPRQKILIDMENISLDLRIKLLEIASTHSGGCFKILKYNYRELVDLMTTNL